MELTNCPKCKNYIGGLKCLAFDDTIPSEILSGINPHTEPLKSQSNSIVFEPLTDGDDIMPINKVKKNK